MSTNSNGAISPMAFTQFYEHNGSMATVAVAGNLSDQSEDLADAAAHFSEVKLGYPFYGEASSDGVWTIRGVFIKTGRTSAILIQSNDTITFGEKWRFRKTSRVRPLNLTYTIAPLTASAKAQGGRCKSVANAERVVEIKADTAWPWPKAGSEDQNNEPRNSSNA